MLYLVIPNTGLILSARVFASGQRAFSGCRLACVINVAQRLLRREVKPRLSRAYRISSFFLPSFPHTAQLRACRNPTENKHSPFCCEIATSLRFTLPACQIARGIFFSDFIANLHFCFDCLSKRKAGREKTRGSRSEIAVAADRWRALRMLLFFIIYFCGCVLYL